MSEFMEAIRILPFWRYIKVKTFLNVLTFGHFEHCVPSSIKTIARTPELSFGMSRCKYLGHLAVTFASKNIPNWKVRCSSQNDRRVSHIVPAIQNWVQDTVRYFDTYLTNRARIGQTWEHLKSFCFWRISEYFAVNRLLPWMFPLKNYYVLKRKPS